MIFDPVKSFHILVKKITMYPIERRIPMSFCYNNLDNLSLQWRETHALRFCSWLDWKGYNSLCSSCKRDLVRRRHSTAQNEHYGNICNLIGTSLSSECDVRLVWFSLISSNLNHPEVSNIHRRTLCREGNVYRGKYFSSHCLSYFLCIYVLTWI